MAGRIVMKRVLFLAIALSALAGPSSFARDPVTGARRTKTTQTSTKPRPKDKSGAAPITPPDGKDYDFAYDGKDVGHPERAWWGRAFVHSTAAKDPEKPLPVFVFLHGTNNEAIKYRWMGAGNEGDLRRMISDLIESGRVGPMILAAPSQIKPESTVNALTAWPHFDLDHFLDQTAARLQGIAKIDRSKVVVAGHSGGACNPTGGVMSAARAKQVFASFMIDGCMSSDLATGFAGIGPKTHAVVTWQTQSWEKRTFTDFTTTWKRAVKKAPAPEGILRELDFERVKEGSPHDAMVKITLDKWLPVVLGSKPAP